MNVNTLPKKEIIFFFFHFFFCWSWSHGSDSLEYLVEFRQKMRYFYSEWKAKWTTFTSRITSIYVVNYWILSNVKKKKLKDWIFNDIKKWVIILSLFFLSWNMAILIMDQQRAMKTEFRTIMWFQNLKFLFISAYKMSWNVSIWWSLKF